MFEATVRITDGIAGEKAVAPEAASWTFTSVVAHRKRK
jgi:hypothetical protein